MQCRPIGHISGEAGRLAVAALASIAVVALSGCGAGTPPPSPSSSAAPASLIAPSSSTAAAPGTQAPLISAPLKVAAPSLANNLLGDPAELDVVVLLPADYNSSGRRYPTIYFLNGFQAPVQAALGYFGGAMAAPAAGTKGMIVVGVSGMNALYGGFYANSPVSGNWEDAIVKDLVGYVDATYRTIPAAASRGIAGHSMGGYGAWNIAMRHPDVFGAVDAIAPGLTDEKGVLATQIFGSDETIEAELTTLATLEALPEAEAKAQFVSAILAADGDSEFALAYGLAFAPDPASKTLMRFPYRETGGKHVVDTATLAAWTNGYGNQKAKIEQYKANLQKLRGIQLEYATADQYGWIVDGTKYVDAVLTQAQIPHKTVAFDGNHEDHVASQVATSLMPFFSNVLEG